MTNFVADLWEALGKPRVAASLRHFDEPSSVQVERTEAYVYELEVANEATTEALSATEDELAQLLAGIDKTLPLLCGSCRALVAKVRA